MFSDLQFLHGAYYPSCRLRVDKHYDNYCTLQLMVGGNVELSYDDTPYALKGNWMWTCQPHTHVRFHVARQARSWAHRYVAFRGPLIQHWKLSGLWFSTPQEVPAPDDFIPLFDELLSLIEYSGKWEKSLAVNLLERILLKLAQERQGVLQTDEREPWLDHLLQQLENGGTESGLLQGHSITYERVAAECGMSLSHLRARFRDLVGVPLHTYVLQRRIATACALLCRTNLPVKAIASQLGYSDVQFFSRQFRRFAGDTPTAYRRLKLQSPDASIRTAAVKGVSGAQ